VLTPKDSLGLSTSNLDLPVAQVNAQIGTLMRRDLGLGLLFVTGLVMQVTHGEGRRLESFLLRDGNCELRADLAPSLRNPPAVQAGQTVRATAWLGFYYPESRFRLIVRDLEILESPAEPETVPAAPALPFVLDERAAGAESIDAAAVPELEHAVLPPWLEEIRRRQFGAGGALAGPASAEVPAATTAFSERDTTTLPPMRAAEAAPEAPVPAAPSPDAELQAWLAELFDASENEDIELTRQEAEVVAVRAGGGRRHFHALGAATVARMQDQPAAAQPGALPAPPPAAQNLLNEPAARHVPVSRAAATSPLPSSTSPLQSRAPEPQPIDLPQRAPLPLAVLYGGSVVLLLVAVLVFLFALWLLSMFPRF
jgi:hypothetical protein